LSDEQPSHASAKATEGTENAPRDAKKNGAHLGVPLAEVAPRREWPGPLPALACEGVGREVRLAQDQGFGLSAVKLQG
jgi:hypothetical protein